MLIKEVCKLSNLTKKAIEYYEKQKLIQPQILDNGYRNFTANDVEQLKKISVLRKLGVSVPDIQSFLDKENTLFSVSAKKALELETLKSKLELMQILAQKKNWIYVQMKLDALEQKQTILERLLDKFPGSYGRYISLHFAFYLNEPITSKEQQEAYETIISFLDSVDLKIPVDLQNYIEEVTRNFDISLVENISENIEKAVQNPEKYIIDNQKILEQYIAYKQTAEYKNSDAYRLQEFFINFQQESGYNEIFIPAMKKLSSSYWEYQDAMEKANEVFKKKYPSDMMQ